MDKKEIYSYLNEKKYGMKLQNIKQSIIWQI